MPKRLSGGASAPPIVLTFPDRHGTRPVRAEIDMSSAGFLSLLLMEGKGEMIPANVHRFDEPEGEKVSRL